ncbi:NAD-dependent epimerase/dehydratase family protein [Amnibacterium sp. CER49]|uniref:NAD-dependent epimerase/dehydratase family protein n=1 Tax=Amnibacterium sp. CER49 TaxID=3039161 RepID=UPI002448CE7F|nr:NAD-dependent epimerase/dehydratase family protein [Amnibacterium sp. CER49]MDH2444914.1 NAD-dependent epimerase/dehydratase family protein [Amnibacterium sp. CER49]
MRIVLIGPTGHIGGYLVPRLVEAGHEVVAISRGQQRLYRDDPAWASVERVTADRVAEDAAGVFGKRIADLEPDAVIDLVCFTAESAEQLLGALAGSGVPLLECGSIWVHGVLHAVPARETDPREPWGDYGLGKLAIERLVLAATERGDVRGAVLHPGHISGPGWPVINPAGNLDPAVWERLAAGERTVLPGSGTETLHHVHADDVAQAFQLALERIDAAAGRAFHVVSERALTLRGYAEAVAGWFGGEPHLEFVPLDEFARTTSPEHAEASAEHLRHSPAASIEAAREALGYAPRFTSLEAAREAVEALAAAGRVRLPAFA